MPDSPLKKISKQLNLPYPLLSLGRAIDLGYPSNRFIVAVTLIAAALSSSGAFLMEGWAVDEALRLGFSAGMTTLLGWILGRELDPDHPASANLGAILAFIGLFMLQAWPNGIALFTLVSVARVVSRTTGLSLRIWEILGLCAIGIYFATTTLWPLNLTVALAFWMDSRLPAGVTQGGWFALLTLLGGGLVAALTQSFEIAFAVQSWTQWAVLITALGVVRLAVRAVPDTLISLTDAYNQPLQKQRIVYTLTLMTLTLLMIAWLRGEQGIEAILSLWAALLGVLGWLGWRRVNSAETP